MKNYIILFLLFVGWVGVSYAQDGRQEVEISGTVLDENKEPLIGASVTVKDRPGFGTVTDADGRYNIKILEGSTLVFSFVGYDTKEVFVRGDRTTVNVNMAVDEQNVLDEVVVSALGAQKKITVTGAVTNVDVSQLRTPTASISNALAGNVPGIIARQTSGQPGDNVSEFWIRGISTFGAGSSALVLVDGFERDLNSLNVEDIETFTVLKDASATAIYGSRGANGVVLITTKRGAEGKTNVNAKVEFSYNTRTQTPEFVDGVTYARMYNEALTTRNQPAAFAEDDIYLIQNGLDPDIFPNVDWMDLVLKKGAPTYRANVDLSGGGSTARYFVSASYVDEGGMYETDESMKDYKTNSNYRRWNYRMNTDLNLTPTTVLRVGVAGALEKKNQPGGAYNEIWESLMGYNPIATPVRYSNGYWGSQGGAGRKNPWILVTQQGYEETWKNTVNTTANLEQDLSFITKGLKFYGRYGFDIYTSNNNRHMKWPEGWKAERLRDSNGDIVFTRVETEQLMTSRPSSSGSRKEYLEAELHYDRTFGDHTVGAVLKYSQDKTINNSPISGSDYEMAVQAIDRKHQALAGRFTYGWKNRYFFDFNFGYNGSENFAPGHQWGFFPAYSLAWNLSEEQFIKDAMPWMTMFKIRYSYGKVGNDYLSENNREVRFPYQETFYQDGWTNDDDEWQGFNYMFGDIGQSNYRYGVLGYSRVASTGITWEESTKHDVGIDFSLWNDKFSGTIDYFHEQRDGIFMMRNYMPPSVGLNHVETNASTNVGSVLSKGFDGNIAFKQKIGEVDFTLRANMTYSKNEILEYDEQFTHYPYTLNTGFRVNQARGWIAEGLFTDYDDIRNHADQSGLAGGVDIAPGDIKYKDVNGDGIIDDNDKVAIGATTVPNMIYGFGLSALWKGFDFNVLFQGAGKSSFFINGFTVYPFQNGSWGNILSDVPGKYWSLGVNEDPNAEYPRLSFNGNSNNYRESTYWLRNGSYLRLKNLEIGYTMPKRISNAMHLENLRIYFMGTNLITFSDFDLWDPEMGSSNGQQYPLSRTYTLGLTLSL